MVVWTLLSVAPVEPSFKSQVMTSDVLNQGDLLLSGSCRPLPSSTAPAIFRRREELARLLCAIDSWSLISQP